MYELGCGKAPWIEGGDRNTEAILGQEIPRLTDRSSELNNLLQSCMCKEPDQRPTIKEVLEDPYLVGAENLRQ